MGTDYILELNGIEKSFPGVKALSNIDVKFEKGVVHGLVGENGAGKSTLMKVLSGAYLPDSGTINFDGELVDIHKPSDAERLGIAIIYQELNLLNKMTVAENIYIGRSPKKAGFISWKEMMRASQEILDEFHIDIAVDAVLGNLSIAEQQIIEIVKAISKNAKLVIMDEPTSSLTEAEIKIMFEMIEKMRKNHVTVIYISHKFEEIFEICDTINIMRDGEFIGQYPVGDISRDEMIEKMIGRKLVRQFPERDPDIGDVILEVDGLCDFDNKVHEVSFELRAGEILGISGLVGAGRTELLELLFGASKKKSGKIIIDGEEVNIKSPKDAIEHRIGFVTENRKEEGLLLSSSVAMNVAVANFRRLAKFGFYVNLNKINDVAEEYVDLLSVKTPSVAQPIRFLSGGNQQKVIIARWLYSDSRILLLDEPTRGIDVGAKKEIYDLINELSHEGKAVILVSSELEEIIGMSDRAIVMSEGSIAGEVDKADFSQHLLTDYALRGRAKN